MAASDIGAWLAVLLFPMTGVAGWILRRFVKGAFVERLRPHFVLGYAVLGLAGIHTVLSLENAARIGSSDLWFAAWALVGLGVQTFIGLSLQAPGAFRRPLRRWHVIATFAVALLIVGHVLLTL